MFCFVLFYCIIYITADSLSNATEQNKSCNKINVLFYFIADVVSCAIK